MTMTQQQAKAMASRLRKAITERIGPVKHMDACEILAAAFECRDWNVFSATMIQDDPTPALASAPAQATSKYPLKNEGQFDFAATGTFVTGRLTALNGTLEDIFDSTADVNSVSRQTSGEMEVEYGGDTDVNWNGQKTRRNAAGERMWIEEGTGELFAESECLITPDDVCVNGRDSLDACRMTLRMRQALVDEYVTYFRAESLVEAVLQEINGSAGQPRVLLGAEAKLGFVMTHRELMRLREMLS